MDSVRQLVNSFRKPDNQTLQNEIKALRDLLEKAFEGFKTSYLDSTVNGMLFLWRKKPFQTWLSKKITIPRPIGRQCTGADCERRSVYQIGRGKDLLIPIQVNGNKIDATVDAGADVTVLSRSFANCIGLSSTTGVKAYWMWKMGNKWRLTWMLLQKRNERYQRDSQTHKSKTNWQRHA